MELKFIKCGDYYVPDIKLKETNIRLGKWATMAAETPCRRIRPWL